VKRHESLRPLSREHHHGLVEARALRWALSGRAGTLRAARASVLATWERLLAAHFEDEERWILGLIPDAADAQRLRAEHDELRRLLGELAREREHHEPDRDLLGTIAKRIDDHIRWEEGHLFPTIEATASAAALRTLGRQLAERQPKSPNRSEPD
jgi:hemerythrin